MIGRGKALFLTLLISASHLSVSGVSEVVIGSEPGISTTRQMLVVSVLVAVQHMNKLVVRYET